MYSRPLTSQSFEPRPRLTTKARSSGMREEPSTPPGRCCAATSRIRLSSDDLAFDAVLIGHLRGIVQPSFDVDEMRIAAGARLFKRARCATLPVRSAMLGAFPLQWPRGAGYTRRDARTFACATSSIGTSRNELGHRAPAARFGKGDRR